MQSKTDRVSVTTRVLRVSRYNLTLGTVMFGAVAGAGWASNPKDNYLAWSGLAVFALACLVGIKMLVSRGAYLRLDPHGFEFDHAFGRSFYQWADVTAFGRRKVGGRRVVRIHFTDEYCRRQGTWLGFWYRLFPVQLPFLYALDAEDLEQLMTQYRTNAAPASPRVGSLTGSEA